MSRPRDRVTIEIEPFSYSDGDRRAVNVVDRLAEQVDAVKVTWRYATTRRSPFWRFDVRPQQRCIEKIRETLDELSNLYASAWKEGIKPKDEVVRGQVKVLAQWGSILHRGLFSDAPSDLRKYLNDPRHLDDPYDITVVVSPKLGEFNVPWGMIFDPRVKLAPEPGREVLQGGFWCMGRRLATVYQNEDGYLPTPLNPGDLASVISRKALEESGGRTDDWPPQGLFSNWMDLVNCQEDDDRRDRVLHIFCHGGTDTLYIDLDEKSAGITSDEFSYYVGKRPEDVLEIPVFNACGSRFAASGPWLNHLWRQGLRGFIGGEAKIPTAFAWEFGRDLVRALLSDAIEARSVAEVLDDLRRKHWPLGLLYGLYADPGVTFRGRVSMNYIPEIPKNWCESLGERASPAAVGEIPHVAVDESVARASL